MRKKRSKFRLKLILLAAICAALVFAKQPDNAVSDSGKASGLSAVKTYAGQIIEGGASYISLSVKKDEEKSTGTKKTEDSDNHSPGLIDRLKRIIYIREAARSAVPAKQYVKIENIPLSLQHAFIAIEDRRFYEHHGFDPNGIARAILVNLQYGDIEEGASTITQQLVKNLFLSHEQTFGRKVEELILAIDIELHFSKDEILELYLNSIYFGSGYTGIYAASEGYFGKEPHKLELPEAAMLAGVPNAPSLYSPYVDFIAAKNRQIIVLDAMEKNGYIDERLAEDARIAPIILAKTR